jgi:hypothetical protein
MIHLIEDGFWGPLVQPHISLDSKVELTASGTRDNFGCRVPDRSTPACGGPSFDGKTHQNTRIPHPSSTVPGMSD